MQATIFEYQAMIQSKKVAYSIKSQQKMKNRGL